MRKFRKNIWAIFSIVILVFSLTGCFGGEVTTDNPETTTTTVEPVVKKHNDNGIVYLEENGVLELIEVLEVPSEGKIVIPSKVDNLSVTSIGTDAFSNAIGLVEVAIPDSIIEIKKGAFEGIKTLTKVIINGTNLTSIGASAFQGCSGIETIELPSSLKTLGYLAFAECKALKNIDFGTNSNLAEIMDSTFQRCDALETITIPSSVASFGNSVFLDCSLLKTVLFEENSKLKSIGKFTFMGCTNLEEILIPESVQLIGESSFKNCTSLSNVAIPNVRKIETSTFENCAAFTKIVIPESVLEIASNAFADCVNVTEISISSKASVFGTNIFRGLTNVTTLNVGGVAAASLFGSDLPSFQDSVTTINIDEKTTAIADKAFEGFTKVTSLNIPETVSVIGQSAFKGCSSLTSINLPNITVLSVSVFENCSGLTGIVIPNTVVSISKNAFSGCTNIKEITLPESIMVIETFPFLNVNNVEKITSGTNFLLGRLFGSSEENVRQSLKEVVYTEGAYSVFEGQFQGCANLTSVTLSSSMGEIAKNAFKESGITSIDLLNIKYIGEQAFEKCVGLTKVTIPNSLISMSKNSFSGCSNLASFTFASDSQITKIPYGFISGTAVLEVVIPDSVQEIQNNAFFNTIVNSITFNEGSKLINIQDEAFTGSKVTSLIIPSNVEKIGVNPFPASLNTLTLPDDSKIKVINSGFISNTSITSLVIPASVTEISAEAFNGSSLSIITFRAGSSLTNIAAGTYIDTQITSFIVPKSVTNIDGKSFPETLEELRFENNININTLKEELVANTKVTSLVIPKSVTSLETGVFKDSKLNAVSFETGSVIQELLFGVFNDTVIESFKVPASVVQIMGGEDNGSFPNTLTSLEFESESCIKTIGDYAFKGSSIRTISNLPNGITNIGNYAFSGCPIQDLVLPQDVLTVGDNAFDAAKITILSIPEKLQSIGSYAFFSEELVQIIYASPSSLSTIGDYAFKDSLLTSIRIPASVKSFGAGLFKDSKKLETIYFDNANKIESIGEYAFSGCLSLKTIEIPTTIKNLGKGAFQNCVSLNEINLSTIQVINEETFDGCSSLVSITLSDNITSLGAKAFRGCEALKVINENWLINMTSITESLFEKCSSLGEIKLPEKIKTVEQSAFADCSSLASFEANGLVSIGDKAFSGCTSLAVVKLNAEVKSIGEGAFLDCYSLSKVVYPGASIQSISKAAFKNCKSLLDVDDILENVTVIEEEAFSDCISLATVTLSNNITIIGNKAFANCRSLKEILIGKYIKKIGEEAFVSCTALKSAIISNEATQLFEIEKSAFADTANLIEFVVPDCVTLLGELSFSASSLRTIDFGTNLRTIGVQAFYQCTNLSKIIIDEENDRIESIGVSAFEECTSLVNIPMTDNIIEIGSGAFKGCLRLIGNISDHTLHLDGASLVAINDNAFEGCSMIEKVIIGRTVNTIGTGAFSKCASLTKVIFVDGIDLKTLAESLFEGCVSLGTSDANKFIIPVSVTKIGNNAFKDCGLDINKDNEELPPVYRGMISIEIPSGVASIGEGAFSGCLNLQNVYFARDTRLIELSKEVFKDCVSLSEIRIDDSGLNKLPETINVIGEGAFQGCGLSTIKMTGKTATIGKSAFANCPNLLTVDFGDNAVLSKLPESIFENSCSLSNVIIPDSVTNIEANAFKGCTGLKSIEIPQTVTSIDDFAFMESGLVNFTISEGITYIGVGLFKNATDLLTVTIAAPNLAMINDNTFEGCTNFHKFIFDDSAVSLTRIGQEAFKGCTALIYLTIPTTVTNIGSEFLMESAIEKLYFMNPVAPAILSNTFTEENYNTMKVIVPIGSLNEYKNSIVWDIYNNALFSGNLMELDEQEGNSYRVFLPIDQEGIDKIETPNSKTTTVGENGNLRIQIYINDGYNATSMVVKRNGDVVDKTAFDSETNSHIYDITGVNENTRITVEGIQIKTFNVTFNPVAGVKYIDLEGNEITSPVLVNYGSDLSFKVVVEAGYTGNPQVSGCTNSGEEGENKFTITNVKEDKELTATGVNPL